LRSFVLATGGERCDAAVFWGRERGLGPGERDVGEDGGEDCFGERSGVDSERWRELSEGSAEEQAAEGDAVVVGGVVVGVEVVVGEVVVLVDGRSGVATAMEEGAVM